MNGAGDDAGWSWWPAPAKLNLFLHITGRRADGYHELQTVFRLLDWGDRIGLRLREDGQVRRQGDGLAGVAEADDLAVRAARLLKDAANIAQGVDIIVEKNVSAGGGFGGGSSDAATVLVVLNRLWRAGLDEDALAALGLRLGADVPVFVRGRNAWAEGVGERLQPITLAPAWYVVVEPGVHVPTPALFADPDLTRDSPVAKIEDFASGTLVGNAFEPVLRRREPAVEAALVALSNIGSARLTGSGSGCFVEFASQAAAEQGRSKLPKELRARVAAGVARSPLLDALEQH
ncbi:4-(cytidine 5'-diphospho)-2-C-methyl-D-erythritol kinase [Stenotrophomonas maltophilia]|uniref:4-(cytidine 5'-diphospho)-2-C-methyl-D-erythritol kinase n=1 Tax=Stenotrophomonas maltophilia TaxID=40324 RepID=UPI0015DFD78F|nr:4-(cytidine 5'-diphospho)-2-C-methyl-D-erythritol kinase [Stenotrophomonas maltophilia]MBA0281680.1 4-(cytidine 5'-diphospho)-2-C-methyl-D-erythritol kinase [Stenotrophomonas maltophilia]MBA0344960.1 4-(cytidine 5'-diphospho)-2-C-methyl-D-erythritol kinase [Stenotrophomonas maltophilia]MBA0356142.1 4-(cytidine 5'-diphospho)-2-C-methyl-D-erythritol kinase [Stenotrophomonas maltophilia]MBA0518451.1 4-(cytidine 5'-diphospho)-2-C-methyl-D-erythritol kinase [Stenotrophomonas maltophilia]MDT34857